MRHPPPGWHAVARTGRQTGIVNSSLSDPVDAHDGGQRLSRRRSLALVAAAAALAISACGSGDDTVSSNSGVETDAAESGTGPTATEPATADADPAGLQQNGPIDVAGAALDPYDSTIEDLSIGMTAPVVRGESFDGNEIVIGGPTENPTMIVFLAHWCPHCNDEVPVLLGLESEGRLPEGLDVIGVSTAVAADRDNYPPSEWIVDNGWSWPTIADDEILSAINAFGGTGFPFTVVLDTDGTVLARRSGGAPADDTVAFLAAALANATA